MRKYALLILISLILVLLQMSFFVEFFGAGKNPNLVVALAFSFILMDDEKNAILSMFIGGLLLNLLSVSIVGLSLSALMLVLYASIYVRRTIFRGIVVQLLFVLFTIFAYRVAATIAFPPSFLDVVISSIITSAIAVILSVLGRNFRRRYKSYEYRIRA